MAFGRAVALLRRLLPFTALLFIYQGFRGLVPHLNGRVHYEWMIHTDLRLTGLGELPTVYLQRMLWHGTPSWYDYLYYATYMGHFLVPLLIVILTWKFRPEMHGFVIRCFLLLTFAGFFTYLLFPAAPPWLAAQGHYIPEIVRVHSRVYQGMNLQAATTLWTEAAPNPVAAVPSLHAGWATLFDVLVLMLFGVRWFLVAMPYPLVIFVGTVYAGEHYVTDELLGIVYALVTVAVVYGTSKRRGLARPSSCLATIDGMTESGDTQELVLSQKVEGD